MRRKRRCRSASRSVGPSAGLRVHCGSLGASLVNVGSWQVLSSGRWPWMPALHPTLPIRATSANGRNGAFSPIRHVVSHRLQSAKSRIRTPKAVVEDARCLLSGGNVFQLAGSCRSRHIVRDRMKTGRRQRVQLMPPGIPAFGKAVAQQDPSAGSPARHCAGALSAKFQATFTASVRTGVTLKK
jgi:hypothetical protein